MPKINYETEEDTKMKKKEWKHRKQIRGEMTEKGQRRSHVHPPTEVKH